MYVVRRAFRNFGQMMAPGCVVEPAAIKRFKSRVADGRIVEVNEHNFDKWHAYFKVRVGVTITLPDPNKSVVAPELTCTPTVEATAVAKPI